MAEMNVNTHVCTVDFGSLEEAIKQASYSYSLAVMLAEQIDLNKLSQPERDILNLLVSFNLKLKQSIANLPQ